MAGTIPISMTQQFDANGVPLSGGKLYVFAAATTTPQSAYSDSGLVTALANPLTLDSSGRVPQFFLADGTIKIRLTDSAGTIQVEYDNVLVIGPSGGGGGGATVDATTVFQTGYVLWLDQSGVLSGFVRDNGRTIGSATSGATERANADCSALFSFLWNTYSDTLAHVVGGRGVSASADWGANKQITLPDKRGYCPVGLTDMGNTDNSALSGVPFSVGSSTAAGSLGGKALHPLVVGEIPVITPAGTISNVVSGGVEGGTSSSSFAGGGFPAPQNTALISVASTFTGTPFGGGSAHGNTQLSVTGSWYRKL